MFSKFSVKKPYTVIVGIVLVILLGFVSFTNMTVDLLPSMNLPYVMVMTTCPGASPEEVEEIVTRPVEQTMATVSNISNVQSVSSENMSTVILEFEQTANMDSVTIEMRESLDQIRGLWPETVGNPLIVKMNPDMLPVLITAVTAEGKPEAEVSQIIEEEVIPEIESVEGVASVSATGSIEETVEIVLNDQQIQNTNDTISREMEAKLQEAQSALNDAKAQVEKGKQALSAGKDQAGAGLSQAEAQLSVKSEELKQAQLEITEKMAELNVSDTQVGQTLALVQSAKQAAQTQKTQLEETKNTYDTSREALEALQKKEEAGQSLTEEEQAEKARLEAVVAELEPVMLGYDAAMGALDLTLEQLVGQEAQIQKAKDQIAEGRKQLETLQKQVNDGAITLAQARGKLASAQLEAAVGLGEGTARLVAGESALQMQETQMQAAGGENAAAAGTAELLSVDTIKAILSAQNFRMPAGYVTENGIDYLVRVGDKFKDISDIKNLVLLDVEGIEPVRLSDIASVELVDNADETYAKINGEPGVMLSIQKQTGYSTGDVSDRVLERLEKIRQDNDGIKTVTLMDQGIYIDFIVDSVLQNLLYGAILAVIILFVFLKSVRSTFIIACSIPISIMAAIVAMYFSGITLNIISLSGLALGVGMLVDNSIVVIENIYRMRKEEGASAKEAAITGARQVGGAIFASTLTTVCVFLPIVFTQGITRQLFVDMGLTIGYSLLASLLVALTVVPMMASGLLKKTEEKESRGFLWIKERYGAFLSRALHKKVWVLLITFVLFVGSIFLAVSRGTEFMPAMESTQISMTLETEKGTSLEDTAKEADRVMEKLEGLEDIEDIGALVSTTDMMGAQTASNQVQFYVVLKENPKLSNSEMKKEIEKRTEDIQAELTVSTSNMDMGALGNSGINIQIKGKDLDKLQEVAADVKKIVEDTKGAQNVLDGTEENDEELRILVNKEKAAAHGLTVAQVYQEIQSMLTGPSKATTLGTDTKDYDVYIADGAKESLTRNDIRTMTLDVKKQDGTVEQVPLASVADFENGSAFQSIRRDAQTRYMSVTAEIKDGDNIGIVSNRIQNALDKYDAPEGYEIKMTGEDETIQESMTELFKMLALALVFMYLIMVAQFQSLRSPFVIMFTVPLAFTGGLLALWIAGMPVSVIAMIGFVMLSGIIVNNGIVFIDYTNQLIAEGKDQHEALVEAGKTRLRPIIMTALTTVLGLSTMAIGIGTGSDMVQPMAVVTIGGLIYGTLLTLVVVPCIFDIFHRKKKEK